MTSVDSAAGILSPEGALFEWIKVLIVPLTLIVLAWFFQRSERRARERTEAHRIQDALLLSYIEGMKDLILKWDLANSPERSGPRRIARSLSLAVFRQLDADRKAPPLRFLIETKLLGPSPIVELEGANLRCISLRNVHIGQVDLLGADLSNADLAGAYLADAYLGEASLIGARLIGTKLQRAKIEKADLTKADLTGAYCPSIELHHVAMAGAILRGADFTEADFHDVRGLTQAQLDSTKSYRGAKNLPAHLRPDVRGTSSSAPTA